MIWMQESTSELRHTIEKRDKMLAVLSEKIQAHMLVLDSIRKEASSVKDVVDNIKHLVIEKEQVGMFSISLQLCLHL